MTENSYHKLYRICADNLKPFIDENKTFLVGFSGGRDSHVLLDIMVRLKNAHLVPSFSVIHVHHGLSSNADSWVEHCQSICRAYGVSLCVEWVKTSPQVGESVEAFARDARYQLIEKHMGYANQVFLSAHHQRDQAETFLLQLMRGAGLDGLRAMPKSKPYGMGDYLRPLLDVPYQEIVDYAEQQQLKFINDESNDDIRFNRNYIRHEVLPMLEKRFPSAQRSIAQSSQWLAEVDEQAVPEKLLIKNLQTLSDSEKKQQIRAFVKKKIKFPLSKTQTQIILDNHLMAAADRHPELAVGREKNYLIRRHQGEIVVTKKLPDEFVEIHSPLGFCKNPGLLTFKKALVFSPVFTLDWQLGEGLLLPENTQLQWKKLDKQDYFQPHDRNHRQRIKKLLHEKQIPVWLRHLVLGIYWQDELIAIPGIGVAKSHYKKSHQAAMPMWQVQANFVKL